jgi:hypothetical protein
MPDYQLAAHADSPRRKLIHLKFKSIAKSAAHIRGLPCVISVRRPDHTAGLTSLAPTRLQIMIPNRKPLYWKCIESRMRKPGCSAIARASILAVLFLSSLVSLTYQLIALGVTNDLPLDRANRTSGGTYLSKPVIKTISDTRTVLLIYAVTAHPEIGSADNCRICDETRCGKSLAGRVRRYEK